MQKTRLNRTTIELKCAAPPAIFHVVISLNRTTIELKF